MRKLFSIRTAVFAVLAVSLVASSAPSAETKELPAVTNESEWQEIIGAFGVNGPMRGEATLHNSEHLTYFLLKDNEEAKFYTASLYWELKLTTEGDAAIRSTPHGLVIYSEGLWLPVYWRSGRRLCLCLIDSSEPALAKAPSTLKKDDIPAFHVWRRQAVLFHSKRLDSLVQRFLLFEKSGDVPIDVEITLRGSFLILGGLSYPMEKEPVEAFRRALEARKETEAKGSGDEARYAAIGLRILLGEHNPKEFRELSKATLEEVRKQGRATLEKIRQETKFDEPDTMVRLIERCIVNGATDKLHIITGMWFKEDPGLFDYWEPNPLVWRKWLAKNRAKLRWNKADKRFEDIPSGPFHKFTSGTALELADR